MPIRFHCTNCDCQLRVARRKAGTSAVCPKCKAVIEVPSLGDLTPDTAESPIVEATPTGNSSSRPERYGLDDLPLSRNPENEGELSEKIQFRCSGCESLFSVGAENAGRSGQCPNCQTPTIIPNATGSNAKTLDRHFIATERENTTSVFESTHDYGDERGHSKVLAFLKQNRKFVGAVSVALFISVVVMASFALSGNNRNQSASITPRSSVIIAKSSKQPEIVIPVPATAIVADADLTPDEIFARNSPSVVTIEIHDKGGSPIGLGSGFVVHENGLIATNYHVIEKAHSAIVFFSDKSHTPVLGVVAHDSKGDIAILKITEKLTVKALQMGSAELPRIGLKVYAIGSPEGFANTLSDGLVSGHRELNGIAHIQTTSPISHGSSGGPLIDPCGKVIGITTSGWKNGQNINFAVPVSQITRFLEIYDKSASIRLLPLVRESDRAIGIIEKEIEIAAGIKMKFCWIPPGKAVLGSPRSEQDRREDEREHDYSCNGYWLAKYPVTQMEYRTMIGKNPSAFAKTSIFPDCRDRVLGLDTSRFPVEMVAWNDCQEFIMVLQKRVGNHAERQFGKPGHFRLPHEDEWEYACRGGKGNKQAYYWGDVLNGTKANCNGTRPYGTQEQGPLLGRPSEVGSYEIIAPHPFGLCDMSGNVSQWCDNLCNDNERVYRGGAYPFAAFGCRSSSRSPCKPDIALFWFGFRICYVPD